MDSCPKTQGLPRPLWGEHPIPHCGLFRQYRPIFWNRDPGGGAMTFGVLGKDEPLLADLIALAFESAGHDCLVFEDIGHAARVLKAVQLDSIVLAVHAAGVNGLEWLETLSAIRPDLPSRALLLTSAALTPEEAARIETLGAEVGSRPRSVLGVEQIVMGRLHKARCKRSGRSQRVCTLRSAVESVH